MLAMLEGSKGLSKFVTNFRHHDRKMKISHALKTYNMRKSVSYNMV